MYLTFFYFGHHMTSIKGGMVCTNDYDLWDMASCLGHGMTREKSDRLQDKYKLDYDNNPLFNSTDIMRNQEISIISISNLMVVIVWVQDL